MTENIEECPKWERQAGERSRQYELFCIYRDLGPSRSIEKVVRKCNESETDPGVSLSYLGKLSGKFRWVARCDAWDDHLDEVARTEQELATKEMVQRQADNSKKIQADIMTVFDKMDTKQPASKLAYAYDKLTSAYDKVTSIERVNRGDPTPENTEKKTGIDELAKQLEAGRKEARKETEERS